MELREIALSGCSRSGGVGRLSLAADCRVWVPLANQQGVHHLCQKRCCALLTECLYHSLNLVHSRFSVNRRTRGQCLTHLRNPYSEMVLV